jgi:hypothetical protein
MTCARVLWCAFSIIAAAEEPGRTVEVSVEQAHGDRWTTVDPRTVFHPGDELRFRFQSNQSGFLYVMDRTPAGEQKWLFPARETGLENDVQAAHEYVIPSSEGSFHIPETAGDDVLFWIVSPTPLNGFPEPPRPAPVRLLPRCGGSVSPCLTARELKIKASVKGTGPLIYEIRIAHR